MKKLLSLASRYYRLGAILYGIGLLILLVLWCIYYFNQSHFIEQFNSMLQLKISPGEVNQSDKWLAENRVLFQGLSKLIMGVLIALVFFRLVLRLLSFQKDGVVLTLLMLGTSIGLNQVYVSFGREDYKEVVDVDGVPLFYYGIFEGEYIGFQRNPNFICNKSLEYFQGMQQGDSLQTEKFWNCIDWLMENKVEDDNSCHFEYNFDFPPYGLKAPWTSSLANAKALYAFVNAYSASLGDEKYFETGKKTLNHLLIPVGEGGMRIIDSEDRWWFAEYPCEDGTSPRVLNGMISTVLAIQRFGDYFQDSVALEMAQFGTNAIMHDLHYYNKDGMSLYDRNGKECSETYHNMYIRLMEQMYVATEEEIFNEYYNIWLEYAEERGWQ